MLLEAQLEKQLESITISQTYEEEMSQVERAVLHGWVNAFERLITSLSLSAQGTVIRSSESADVHQSRGAGAEGRTFIGRLNILSTTFLFLCTSGFVF